MGFIMRYAAACAADMSSPGGSWSLREIIRKSAAGDEDMENGRPSYAVLDNLMLRLDGIELPVSWETALEEYMKNALKEWG